MTARAATAAEWQAMRTAMAAALAQECCFSEQQCLELLEQVGYDETAARAVAVLAEQCGVTHPGYLVTVYRRRSAAQ